MFNSLLYVFVFTVIGIIIPSPAFAKNISFTSTTTTLASDESMVVSASASGFADGESIYIKGAFYADGSTNYFGFTQKDDQWVKNSATTTEQKRITIGSWDGMFHVKADPSDSGFSQSGNYKLKLGFYTINGDGEASSVRWSSSSTDIFLHKPPPTSTPTNVPTSAPTHTQVPTSTQVPSKAPTSQFSSPTLKRTATPEISALPTEVPAAVLGDAIEVASITATTEQQPTVAAETKKNSMHVILPILFVGLGTGILSVVTLGGTIWSRIKNKRNGE